MKNLVVFMFFAVMAIVFSSCQKNEELLPVDTDVIRAQLMTQPVLTKEEVQQKVAEQNSLKSASNEPVLVRLFVLDQSTFEVYDDHAIKYFVYYEINQNGYREKLLTISQQFDVVDGQIVSDGYSLKVIVGCPFSRYFLLENQNYVNQVTVFFHFADGTEFAYHLDRNSSEVKLPPITDGAWQLSVSYDDGDMQQSFMSNMINFWEDEVVNLRFYTKSTSKIHLEINRSYFSEDIKIIQVSGKDQDGNWNWFLLPVAYEGFDEIVNFDLPFQIRYVYLCGEDGCSVYSVEDDIETEINITTGAIYYKIL